jgi:hypothetical protein
LSLPRWSLRRAASNASMSPSALVVIGGRIDLRNHQRQRHRRVVGRGLGFAHDARTRAEA